MNFDDAFTQLLGNEGAYSDNPADKGGETMWGITAAVARANGYNGAMRELGQGTAAAIYRKLYWNLAGCDAVPDALKFDLFDTAVNQGPVTAVKILQDAVGEPADGILGPHTLMAIQRLPAAVLLFHFDASRLVAYTTEPDTQWATFGRGWIRRVASNMRASAQSVGS